MRDGEGWRDGVGEGAMRSASSRLKRSVVFEPPLSCALSLTCTHRATGWRPKVTGKRLQATTVSTGQQQSSPLASAAACMARRHSGRGDTAKGVWPTLVQLAVRGRVATSREGGGPSGMI